MRLVPKREQLTDAHAMAWVLERWKKANELHHQRQAEGFSSLVDDDIVRYWLESGDGKTAAAIIDTLPPPCIEQLANDLFGERVEGEGSGPSRLHPAAYRAMLVRMAEVVPHKALPLVQREAETVDLTKDLEGVKTVVQACLKIGPWALDVLETLICRLDGSETLCHAYDTGLLKAAVAMRLPAAGQLVVGTVKQLAGVKEFAAIPPLEAAFSALAPDTPYLELVLEMGLDSRGYLLEDLPELFEEDAPLAKLDQLVNLGNWSQLPAALALLRIDGPFPELACFTRELVSQVPPDMRGDEKKLFYLFVVAVCAAQFSKRTWTFEPGNLRYLLDLYTVDVRHLPFENELKEAIKGTLRPEDSQVLIDELNVAGAYRGAARLIHLMDEVHDPAFLEPLLDCLLNVADREASDVAIRAIARFGNTAVASVLRRWPKLEGDQRVQAIRVLSSIGTRLAARRLAELFPDVIHDEVALIHWCAAAENMPDKRLMKLLKQARGPAARAGRAYTMLSSLPAT